MFCGSVPLHLLHENEGMFNQRDSTNQALELISSA
jgi:hypothetical protein